MFAEYVTHGWSLVGFGHLEKGPKQPGWSAKSNACTDPTIAQHFDNAGLCHAYSGTCALDVDDYDLTESYLKGHGIELRQLFSAADAVQIVSGRKNRGKLIYRMPAPLPSLKLADGAFELRSGTRAGTTVQDALPPSVHPNGNTYEWKGDWRKLPPVPDALLALWKAELGPARGAPLDVPATADAAELAALLSTLNPDAGYDEWLRAGMACHHESQGDGWGLAVWDAWSATGDKYVGTHDLESHWQSFGRSGGPVVTAGSLRMRAGTTSDQFDDLTVGHTDASDPEMDLFADEDTRRADAYKFEPLPVVADRPAPTWIVKGVVPREELVMVYGASGAGKSFAVLDLCLAVARGIDWRSLKTIRGNVAWVAAEAFGSMRNRARACAIAHEFELGSVRDSFYVLGGRAIDLGNAAEMKSLALAAKSVDPALIVVDTLAAASGGANENSGEDMNTVMDSCRMLHRATGATVLIVHHSGKDEERGARGWSGIKAAVTTEIEIQKVGETGDYRMMKVTKMRDGADGLMFPFKLPQVTIGTDDDGELVTSCVVEHVMNDDRKFAPGHKPGPAAGFQKQVWETMLECVPLGDGPVNCDEVVASVARRLTPPAQGDRDTRKQRTARALDQLAQRGLVEILDGRVSLVDQDAPISEEELREELL
jgi:KaiC/GvpD/RAD55 family RecA-like ATPase